MSVRKPSPPAPARPRKLVFFEHFQRRVHGGAIGGAELSIPVPSRKRERGPDRMAAPSIPSSELEKHQLPRDCRTQERDDRDAVR